jgi:hypothetical protein
VRTKTTFGFAAQAKVLLSRHRDSLIKFLTPTFRKRGSPLVNKLRFVIAAAKFAGFE